MAEKWKDISIKDKMQIFNGTTCVFAAIILYFVAFFIMFIDSFQLVSAGAMLLATGLAFFGITSYVKSQMLDFETRMYKRMSKIENSEKENNSK